MPINRQSLQNDRIAVVRRQAEIIERVDALTQKDPETGARKFHSRDEAEIRSLGDELTAVDAKIELIDGQLKTVGDIERSAAITPATQSRARYGYAFRDGASFRDLANGRCPGVVGVHLESREHAYEEMGKVFRGMSTIIGSGGGFVVPDYVWSDIFEMVMAASKVLNLAQVHPLRPGDNGIVYETDVPDPAFRGEGDAIAASDSVFAVHTVSPKSLATDVELTRELVNDWTVGEVGQYVAGAIARGFARRVDQTLIDGSGVGDTPAGILSAVYSGINATGIAADLAWDHLVQAKLRLATNFFVPNAVLLHDRDEVNLTTRRADAAAAADGLGDFLRPPGYVADLPRVVSTRMPVTQGGGTDSSVVVGDFNELHIGMREDLTIARDDSVGILSGKIHFVAHMRFDTFIARQDAFEILTGVTA